MKDLKRLDRARTGLMKALQGLIKALKGINKAFEGLLRPLRAQPNYLPCKPLALKGAQK